MLAAHSTGGPAPSTVRPAVDGAVDVRAAILGAGLLLAVAGGIFAFDLGRAPLLDPDEARHAEVAREMAAARGLRRLVLPTYEFRPYHEKPAGHYWLLALAYGIAGPDAWAARAPSALAALIVVLAVYLWALPRHGVAGALGAALVLATCAGWFGLARRTSLDMTLTACTSVAVLAGLAWLDRPPPRRPPLVPYLGAALGTLVKGPVALALVALPLAAAALLHRARPTWRELGLARGFAVTALVTALLYLPVALLDPTYLRAFMVTNVRRFAPGSPHGASAFYYLLWVPILALPWSLLAVPALRRAGRDPAARPLLAWALVVPVFLTLARGKRPTYALTALVPLALLIGPALARVVRDGADRESRGALRIAAGALVAVLVAGAVTSVAAGGGYPVSAAGRTLLATTFLAWAGAVATAVRRRRESTVPLLTLGAVLTLYPLGVRQIMPAVALLHSDHAAAQLIEPFGHVPVVSWGAHTPSLVFYLGAPPVHSEDPALVRELFAGDGPAFLVAGHRHFATVEGLLGEDAHRWHGTRRRRLYGNRPPP
jgi:4-amino-4-deoxy-L-arabinose transferase-like glycosyltransferase